MIYTFLVNLCVQAVKDEENGGKKKKKKKEKEIKEGEDIDEDEDEKDSDSDSDFDLEECTNRVLMDPHYYYSPLKSVHVLYYVRLRLEGTI